MLPHRACPALTLAALVLSAAFAGAGCGHSIGDGCRSNVDCSPAGDRFCDLSTIGGYCTVEGCDINTCPDGEPCVRFLTVVRNRPCHLSSDPTLRCDPTSDPLCCNPDERCVPDTVALDGGAPPDLARAPDLAGAPDGGAAPPTFLAGHCAPESSERRWCLHRCTTDSNCRDANYVCRSTSPAPIGSQAPALPGALPVASVSDPTGASNAASFCVQHP